LRAHIIGIEKIEKFRNSRKTSVKLGLKENRVCGTVIKSKLKLADASPPIFLM